MLAILLIGGSLIAQTKGRQDVFDLKNLQKLESAEKVKQVNVLNANKDALVAKMRLDSIILDQYSFITSSCEISAKESYDYNEFGLNTVYTSAGWNDTSMEFEIGDSTEYFYGSSNLLDSIVFQEIYASSGVWTYDWKEAFTYNADDLVSVYTNYGWESNIENWEPEHKEEFFYDANHNDTLQMIYDWNELSLAWDIIYKTLKTFNTDNSIEQAMTYNWDSFGATWFVSSKDDYSYNLAGLLLEKISSNWTGTDWQNSMKTERIYSADNKLLEEVEYYWQDTVWGPSYKSRYSYDNDGHVENVANESWDDMTSIWMDEVLLTLTHDNNWLLSDLVLPHFFDDEEVYLFFSAMLTDYSAEIFINGMWLDYMAIDTYYSQIEYTGNEPVEESNIKVYPNPTSDNIRIDLGSANVSSMINLYNIVGTKLISKEVNGSDLLDLSNLPNGIYILTMEGEDAQVLSRRIVKQ